MSKEMNVSVLSYARSLSPSEGRMFGVVNGVKIPVKVSSHTVRGVKASYKESKATKAPDSSVSGVPDEANIQTVDTAYLPDEAETLAVTYSLIVSAMSTKPNSCDSVEFYDYLNRMSTKYRDIGGYNYLAKRYLWNIINGRAMWRNGISANKRVTVNVPSENRSWQFLSESLHGNRYPGDDAMPSGSEELSTMIGDSLSGQRDPLFLEVVMEGDLPGGSEVYPSQEFVYNESKTKKNGDKTKTLSSKLIHFQGSDFRQATMHSQKIGNALRRIDQWHNHLNEYGVIPVEPLGNIVDRSIRIRIGEGKASDYAHNFYYILRRIDQLCELVEGCTSDSLNDEEMDDVHFFMAVLIRGGVFAMEGKNTKQS